MKRRHTFEEPEPELKSRKRAKHAQYSPADLFSDPTSRRYVSGIIQNPTDNSGFIACQVFMLLKKPYICFTAHTEEDEIGKTITQVEIHFQGYCLECLQQRKIQFDIGDKFRLALKGSSLYFGKKGRVILKYEDGALIQFTERRQAELDQSPIDTWDWFQAPAGVRDVPVVAEREIGTPPGNEEIVERKHKRPRHKHKKDQKARKAAKRAKLEMCSGPPNDDPPKPVSSEAAAAVSATSGHTSFLDSYTDAFNLIATEDLGRQVRWPYSLLNKVERKQWYSVTGVVVDAGRVEKREGKDYHRSFKLVDPTCYQLDDTHYQVAQSVSVNYFTKEHENWIPAVQQGDVVVLSGVRGDDYYGQITLTSGHNQTKWAIYSASSRSVHWRIDPSVTGTHFSPFYVPLEVELRFYHLLSEWWQGVQKKQKESLPTNVQTVQLNDVYRRSVVSRPHLLIQDVDPNRNRGFFDCTVEIMNGYYEPERRRYYALYVSDYTSNDNLHEVQAEWCPKGLSKSIFKIELWDNARTLGDIMKTGQYYSLKNVRVKLAPNGLYEGNLQERKADPLEVKLTDRHPELKVLLQRKEAWKVKYSLNEPEFESLDIADVPLDKFFNCTVEILHSHHSSGPISYIYVTDYTRNDYLDESYHEIITEPWASDYLEGRILKIYLQDEQSREAKNLKQGDACVIEKLRIKRGYGGRKSHGNLGGRELKIHKLNPNVPSDQEKIDILLSRKAILKDSTSTPRSHLLSQVSEKVPSSKSLSSAVPKRLVPTFTINDMKKVETCPSAYRLSARVIDYRPLSLRDAVYRICTACDDVIPDVQKACTKCNDTDHEYIRFVYGLSLIIEDVEGTRIRVNISDKHNEDDPKDCPLLEGLRRVQLDDDEAYDQFCRLFDSFAGNARKYYEQHGSSLTTPFRNMTIICLPDTRSEDNGRAYYLWNVDGAAI